MPCVIVSLGLLGVKPSVVLPLLILHCPNNTPPENVNKATKTKYIFFIIMVVKTTTQTLYKPKNIKVFLKQLNKLLARCEGAQVLACQRVKMFRFHLSLPEGLRWPWGKPVCLYGSSGKQIKLNIYPALLHYTNFQHPSRPHIFYIPDFNKINTRR